MVDPSPQGELVFALLLPQRAPTLKKCGEVIQNFRILNEFLWVEMQFVSKSFAPDVLVNIAAYFHWPIEGLRNKRSNRNLLFYPN